MKKILIALVCAAASSLVACLGATALDEEVATKPAPAAPAATAVPSPGGPVTYPTGTIVSVPPSADIRLPPPSGIGSIKPLSVNSIAFATCDSEQAVLVRRNADDPCSHVIAIARHVNVETGLVTIIKSDFAWSVKDTAVAQLEITPGHEHDAAQRLTTQIDALTPQAGGVEPTTEAMACTIPPSGLEVEPVCGSVLVKAIIDLSGNWFFSGPALGSTGAPVTITQIGRNALVNGSLKGTINDLTFKFSDAQFEYELAITSPKKMSGTYWAIGSSAKIDWFAYRY